MLCSRVRRMGFMAGKSSIFPRIETPLHPDTTLY
ncbi:hypothetical protein X989_5868 [Burkholderia pseudomallei MSHR4378]|nr:hypothetical protein X948_5637 [Burkholderia pseudomallei MSHR5608]KGS16646.1 hypothetical protein X989_5868 [Burkholderia pseudomallei MSHR4378]